VSAFARQALEADGVTVLTGHKALRCEAPAGEKCIVVEAGGAETRIGFDVLLCAVGRSARLQGLRPGGARHPSPAHRADQRLPGDDLPEHPRRGDVAGPYQFTHTASHQAWYAAVNALFGR
jgi:pyruvate/2-oxoglutarate dehydrogenase complex dihydrolipoamide dehydrogenase (E3) component